MSLRSETLREARIQVTTLGDLLLLAADRYPDSPALIFPGEQLTYAQLAERAIVRARSLQALGVKPRDHVGLLLPTSFEFVEFMFAIALCGAVVVPMNARYKHNELAYVVENADLVAVVTTDRIAEHVNFVERLGQALPGLSRAPDPRHLALSCAPRLRNLVLLGESGTSATGSRTPTSPVSWRRNWASWACWACTSTATAAPARAPWPTGWPAWSLRPPTPACAASSPCRARWRCSPSTSTAPRSRSDSGCPAWPPATAIGCFGLTEPDFGSNPAGMRTRAVRDGSDWVLTGTKMWITNGDHCRRRGGLGPQTEDGIRGLPRADRHARLQPPRDRPASSPCAPRSRPSSCSTTCRLPADARSSRRRGLRGPLSCLNEARFGIVFGAMGAARDCLRDGHLNYATHAMQFDRPIAAFQLTQEKLVDMAGRARQGRCCSRCTWAGSRTPERSGPSRSASASSTTSARPSTIARTARTILGANGISGEYPRAAARQQPGIGAHLRGHQRDPHAGRSARPSPASRRTADPWSKGRTASGPAGAGSLPPARSAGALRESRRSC